LTVRNKLQAETARQRERRTSALYAMSRELSAVRSRDDIVTIAIRHMSNVFDADVFILLPDDHSALKAIGPAGANLVEHDKGVAEWVHRHGETAGPGTSNLPGSKSIYVPLTTSDGTIGVVALLPHAQTRFVEPERLHLIEAFASHAALAIERANLAYAA
jgi:two-component system sensor histidine kinase KdpD